MIQVRYYLPPRNAVLRESPVMAIYKDGRRVFKGSPIEGIWTALELAGVTTTQQPNEIFPEQLEVHKGWCECADPCTDPYCPNTGVVNKDATVYGSSSYDGGRVGP